MSILDPLLQLAQAAVVSPRLTLGTNVYLLPLRHPGPVAKQVASLDHLCEGRLIFGVGVGGEFPKEFAVAGVALNERGARLSAAIPLLRQLWSGEPVDRHRAAEIDLDACWNHWSLVLEPLGFDEARAINRAIGADGWGAIASTNFALSLSRMLGFDVTPSEGDLIAEMVTRFGELPVDRVRRMIIDRRARA